MSEENKEFHKPSDLNRSGALSAEQQGMVNSAVSESIKALFAGLLPAMEGMQLTPEKLRAALTPLPDEDKVRAVKRERRERAKSQADKALADANTKARQDACLHVYPVTNASSICNVHNFVDRQARGTCMICGAWIHPAEWRIMAGDPDNPAEANGKAVLVPAHRDYGKVMQIEIHGK